MPVFLETVWIMVSFPELRTIGEKHTGGVDRKSSFSPMFCCSCSLDIQAGCLVDMGCRDLASGKDSRLEYGFG